MHERGHCGYQSALPIKKIECRMVKQPCHSDAHARNLFNCEIRGFGFAKRNSTLMTLIGLIIPSEILNSNFTPMKYVF